MIVGLVDEGVSVCMGEGVLLALTGIGPVLFKSECRAGIWVSCKGLVGEGAAGGV